MSKMLLVLYLLAALIPLAISTNTESGNMTMEINSCDATENLTFAACSDGLPWPIEDFTSISVLITHGIHCVDILQHNDSNSAFHQFHQEHCLELMREIQQFFRETPDFSLPKDRCRDFRDVAFPGGRVRRGYWQRRIWNGRKRREAGDGAQQDLDFKGTATRNFELLLLKEKRDGSKLSQSEKRYLAGSGSPLATRMAALGIFCKYESYVEVVRDVVNLTPVLL